MSVPHPPQSTSCADTRSTCAHSEMLGTPRPPARCAPPSTAKHRSCAAQIAPQRPTRCAVRCWLTGGWQAWLLKAKSALHPCNLAPQEASSASTGLVMRPAARARRVIATIACGAELPASNLALLHPPSPFDRTRSSSSFAQRPTALHWWQSTSAAGCSTTPACRSSRVAEQCGKAATCMQEVLPRSGFALVVAVANQCMCCMGAHPPGCHTSRASSAAMVIAS